MKERVEPVIVTFEGLMEKIKQIENKLNGLKPDG